MAFDLNRSGCGGLVESLRADRLFDGGDSMQRLPRDQDARHECSIARAETMAAAMRRAYRPSVNAVGRSLVAEISGWDLSLAAIHDWYREGG